MEAIAKFIKVSIPAYLKRLPIPEDLEDVTKLTGDDYIKLVPFWGLLLFLVYCIIRTLIPPRLGDPGMVNQSIEKDKKKVADVVDLEDLGDKTSFCRCWKSSKFPYCDGAHKLHNQQTGDNVGPVVIKRKGAAK